jgi:hypothetical protein
MRAYAIDGFGQEGSIHDLVAPEPEERRSGSASARPG